MHPDNNYSEMYEEITPIKVISRLLAAILILIPIIAVSRNILVKYRETKDCILKKRIEFLLLGNSLIILIIILAFIDTLIPQSYTVFIFISYGFYILAITSIGLAIIAPNWFIRLIKKRYNQCR